MPRRALLILLLLALCSAPARVFAQTAPASPAIRYHYGDNPTWASPTFDDSSWPVAPQGSWPVPAFHSDGFVWIRARVPVPAASSGTLAIRVTSLGSYPEADRIFVNGRNVGGEGGFPPQGQPVYFRQSAVFPLSAGTATPGSTAVVVLRLWYVPVVRLSGGRSQLHFRISDSEAASTTQRADLLAETLGRVPDLALNALMALLGLGLLVFWFLTRRTELLWCALLLISYPLLEWFFDATDLGLLSIPYRDWALIEVLLSIPGMVTTVEFIWTVHGLRARGWRRSAHFSWILYNGAHLAVCSGVLASPLVWWSNTTTIVFVQIFNAITLVANLWVLLIRRYNRAIAAAMCVIPIASALAYFGWWESWTIGTVYIDLFNLGFLLSGFAIAAMLIQRAVAAWRQGDHLRIEFAAAREVQQQLVPAALPAIDRFRVAAAYLPAAEVGGDFYQVLPQPGGSALLIVGDVSGKGLRAAMTGTLVLGAFRSLAQENLPPAQILSRLNAQLLASSDGGFVTCLCAHIQKNGALTLANAGHLSPYRNGEELQIESGLPLGITADTTYAESALTLASRDTLTFLSDGVVEAQSPAGELFGFDRARQISTHSAESIAQAAHAFGQQDDITVLTLQFAPVEVAHA
ncbi:MAG: SpoIIE family protein phosphatase [Acidobacteriaceae bacterium]